MNSLLHTGKHCGAQTWATRAFGPSLNPVCWTTGNAAYCIRVIAWQRRGLRLPQPFPGDGRVDDVINVAGPRLGTAEVECALVAHPSVAEAAVVGYPHPLKGQGIFAYVTLKSKFRPSDDLRHELGQWVRKEIGPIATPDVIQWAPSLPKTRSGKIMRRILRKVAASDYADLGDISTLADPAMIEGLIRDRRTLGEIAEGQPG